MHEFLWQQENIPVVWGLLSDLLHHGMKPWFIPMAEPWRNGMVEQFNDRYRENVSSQEDNEHAEELHAGSLAFEHRHNSQYRF